VWLLRIYFKMEAGECSWFSDSLRAGWSRVWNPVGARISIPVQTGSEAHPASYTMSTGYFPGVKLPGCGIDHPPLSSAEVKERVELYLHYPSGPSWPVLGWTLPLYLKIFVFYVIAMFRQKASIYVLTGELLIRWLADTTVDRKFCSYFHH
jgi:hypothetical protein